jgi:nucleoside-diphosphate-sugar epimerase
MTPERPVRHLILTGAQGYLGRAIIEKAIAGGLSVTALSRSARGLPREVHHLPWRLGDGLPAAALAPDLPGEQQALLHLAHDWRDSRDEENINEIGARVLRNDARQAHLGRLIFVSSLSARRDALNGYGRAKHRIEQLFDASNEVSLRVGLVYGGPAVGQYGLLCRLVRKTSVLPMVAPRKLVQPIHRDEIAEGLLLAAHGTHNGILALAGAMIPFHEFLDILCRMLRGGRMRLIPIPLRPMLLVCDITRALPFCPSIDRERVLGLAGARPMDADADLVRLGLNLRPFADRMAEEPQARRAVLSEGQALMTYISGRAAGGLQLRRYARAVTDSGRPGALRLSFLIQRFPFLLRFVEPFGAQNALGRRLALAMPLAQEPSVDSHARRPAGRGARLADLALDFLVDLIAIPTRLAAAAFRR